ncbi:MAG: glycosyltransferase family 4 protein [Nitrosarchaeum sp.]|nr:glycosyltransferase family 4 protein [Nitrosarchaeum sp.]
MRIGIVLDWNVNASSLMNINRNLFRELGKIMNETKSFTISAIKESSVGIGDINHHYDVIHIPNMGGYRFPVIPAQNCKNLILGLSGIDEVIYGNEVFTDSSRWKIQEPLIKTAINNWKSNIDKIKSIHVVTSSEYNEMHQYLGIPHKKMTIIPHGVNHDFFKPPTNKEKTRKEILHKFHIPESRYFLHVGETNWKRKNHLRIIEAYAKAKKSGLKHSMIFVGKYNSKIKKIGEKIPGVFFLGWLSNEYMLKFMQGADAFILPSIHEGFGMPLVESMACGVPCITSNNHAPPEVVGNSGLLVNPRDASEISEKMLQIVNDKLQAELSKKAINQAKLFSWEDSAKKILNLYDNGGMQTNTFEEDYEVAAYRTLTTVCELYPDSKQRLIESLLQFDYSKMISWALEDGLYDEKTRDFLLPFESWLNKQNTIMAD